MIDRCFFLESSNRWCKSYLRFKFIPFRQTMGIEAGFEGAADVVELDPFIVWSEIVCNFEGQSKASAPAAQT